MSSIELASGVVATLGDPSPREGRANLTVDMDEGYPTILAEYREVYAEGSPARGSLPNLMDRAAGKPIGEKVADKLLEELFSDTPSQYWLTVAYQTMKTDVQRRMGFAVNMRFKHPSGEEGKERWALRNAPEGGGGRKSLDPEVSAGIYYAEKGMELRHHIKALRGSFPS